MEVTLSSGHPLSKYRFKSLRRHHPPALKGPPLVAEPFHEEILEDDRDAPRVEGIRTVRELKVQVGLGAVAGVAELANDLAAGDGVARLHLDAPLLQVSVVGVFASVVAEDDIVAERRLVALREQLVLGHD